LLSPPTGRASVFPLVEDATSDIMLVEDFE
jgi:hypothetical protein